MAGRCQLAAIQLRALDFVVSAEETRDGSISYVDIHLKEDLSTTDLDEHLDDRFSYREPPEGVDARIIDEDQPNTGIFRT